MISREQTLQVLHTMIKEAEGENPKDLNRSEIAALKFSRERIAEKMLTNEDETLLEKQLRKSLGGV